MREVIGFAALAALAVVLDKGKRPPLTRRLAGLFALGGFLSALIRITIIAALQNAGPDVTAAITPATPVITLLATLALGTETLRVHTRSGHLQLAGMALCSVSACAMGLYKGPRLFGVQPTGAHAPSDIPLGSLFMLFNCVISALVQIVNKKALAEYPLLSSTALVEASAVFWLATISAVSVPASAWWVDGSVLAAVFFGGLLATAANNIFLARANKRLGPLVANMYVPVQPCFTAILDYIFLGDAFYLMNLICGVGVVAGLLLVKRGKVVELEEIGRAVREGAKALTGVAVAGDKPTPEEGQALIAVSERLVRRMSTSMCANLPVESLLELESLADAATTPRLSAAYGGGGGGPGGGDDQAPGQAPRLSATTTDRTWLLDSRED